MHIILNRLLDVLPLVPKRTSLLRYLKVLWTILGISGMKIPMS